MKRLIIIAAAILIALPLSLNAQRNSSGRKAKEKRSVSRSKASRADRAKSITTHQRSKSSRVERAENARTQNRNKAVRPSGTKRTVSQSARSARNQGRVSNSNSRLPRSKNVVQPINRDRDRKASIYSSRKQQRVDRERSVQRNHAIARNENFRKRYYRGNYTRRSHGSTHGHINHFYGNRRIARNHYHVYRKPAFNVYFRPAWYRFYVDYFPDYRIRYSRELRAIPGNLAYGHIGDVRMVYGKVYESYYDPQNKEFFLYFGAPYPGQDFTVVITGRDAKRMSRRSVNYFIGRDFSVAGLITSYNGDPEIVISDADQLRRF